MLGIRWFVGAATASAATSREVPARVSLVLALLVLLSTGLVAAVAREARR